MKQFITKFFSRMTLVAVATTVFAGTSIAADVVVTLDNIGTNISTTANTTAATTNITATGTTDSYTLNYYQCKKQGSAMLMTKSVSPYISNHTAMPGNIKSVEVFINSGAAAKTTYDCAFSTTECNSAVSGIGAVNITAGNSHTFSNLVGGNVNIKGKYFCITLGNANNGQVLKLVITCESSGGSSAVATTTTIDHTGITNTDVHISTTAGSLSATVKDASNNTISGASVTWSGNNDDVATINASTGAVTLVGAGTVTFTASYAGVENQYQASSATYQMIVTDSTPFAGGDLTFDLSSNPGGWPTENSTTLTDYTYLLDGRSFTFSLKNAKCNSGYLMLTATAVVGLPAIEGFKLTKVVASNTNGCSTSTNVGISNSPSSESYVSGGAKQVWSTQGSSYTYNLTSTAANTVYYLYVTNKNAQVTSITLTYEATSTVACATPTFSPAAGTYTSAQNVTISTETEGATIYYTTDGTNPTTNSNVYSSQISISSTTTIKAMAAKTDYDNSEIASATYTFISLDHAGTQADPYSVSDARTAIDNNYGLTEVYATGIVSAIPTAWDSQHSNITFNFVDESGDTGFLQAYRCASSVDADASDVQVGDIVVVYGNLTKYQTTYEFGQGCTLVSLTHPSVTVEAPTFSPVAGTYTSAQTVTIASETSGASIYYTTDGTTPTSNSTLYEGAISVSSLTTIKAIAVLGADESTVSTATYHFCSQSSPYTVTQALSFIEYPANGIYVSGIVSTAPSQTLTNNGELTYYISVDGEDQNQLEVYKGKGLNQAAFTAQDDLQVGDIVTVYGNVVIYNNTKEFSQGNYLVAFERPASTEPSITVTPATANPAASDTEGTLSLSYENLEISDASDFGVQFCDENGDELASGSEPDWIDAEVDISGSDYVVVYAMDTNEGDAARTAYLKVFAMGTEDFVYSNLVTITQAAHVEPVSGDEYTLYSGTLVEGDYIIYYDGAAMKNSVSSDRLQYEEISPVNNVITPSKATIVWHIAPSGDYWTIYSPDLDEFAAGTGVKNKAQMLADGSDDKSLWTVSGTETYEFVNKANAAANVNANLRKNTTYGFACYAEGTGGSLSLYKRSDAPATITLTGTLDKGRYWTTFYNSAERYTLPDGAMAFTMNSNHELYRLGSDGKVIPANTAVVIMSDSPSIILTKSNSTSAVTVNGGANILRGSNYSIEASNLSGTPHVMGKVNNALGYYEYSGDSIPAMKAYYKVNE